MHSYSRLPVAFERGEGVYLYDAQGRAYLDALSGIGVCSLGHSHPDVVETVRRQSARLTHVSNLYEAPEQAKLAERLAAITGLDAAFFCNSGAEANEAAIKLVRRQAQAKGVKRPVVVTVKGAFHGRTLATLAAAKMKGARQFAPLPGAFKQAAFGDLAALEQKLDASRDACAVMLEPIQGEGGVRPLPEAYLRAVRSMCDERGLWLILDEVQTGVGRTGAWYAHQHEGIRPDVLTSAKALGNGVPIGVCLAAKTLAFSPGEHGSTFGGNPLASATALTVLDVIERDGLCERAAQTGEYIVQGLREGLAGVSGVREVRGRGMMIGIELKRACTDLVGRALERRLLINVASGKVIRLLPPLIMAKTEADTLVNTLSSLVRDFLRRKSGGKNAR